MIKKIFTLCAILSLAFLNNSNAQLRLAGGVGLDLFTSKYIVDDNIDSIDLKDYHNGAFNAAPHINLGIDIGDRVRILTGIDMQKRTDNYDFSYYFGIGSPSKVLTTVTNYTTIPLSVTCNLTAKDSKSRLPIGLGIDFSSLKKVTYSSSDLTSLFGTPLPVTYSKGDSAIKDISSSMTSYIFTIGYGYKINDYLGIDALLFAKYDSKSFDTSVTEYNQFATAGGNITIFYLFDLGKKD